MLKMAEKGMTTNIKNQIIIKKLHEIAYEDTEISVLSHILEMIRKRKWLSNDPQARYLTTTKGLSISTVGYITEALVAEMNEQMEILVEYTQVTEGIIDDKENESSGTR